MLFRAGCLIFTSTVIGYLSTPHSSFKEFLSLLKSNDDGDFNENVTKSTGLKRRNTLGDQLQQHVAHIASCVLEKSSLALQQNFVAVLSRKNSVSRVACTPN